MLTVFVYLNLNVGELRSTLPENRGEGKRFPPKGWPDIDLSGLWRPFLSTDERKAKEM